MLLKDNGPSKSFPLPYKCCLACTTAADSHGGTCGAVTHLLLQIPGPLGGRYTHHPKRFEYHNREGRLPLLPISMAVSLVQTFPLI